MLRLKSFCSLKALELFTKHKFTAYIKKCCFVCCFFSPSLTAPSISTELRLPAVRLVSETPSMRRRKRTVAGPMAKVCLCTSLGTDRKKKVTYLPAHRPQRSPQAGRLCSGDGAVDPRSPQGTASAAGASSALTSGESDPGGQGRPPTPPATGDKYPGAALAVGRAERRLRARLRAARALPGTAGTRCRARL